ncbi:MAG: hypothetical protein AVDCRST_MAG64-4297, partial [uncultured Phycisphaerae bacterium]
ERHGRRKRASSGREHGGPEPDGRGRTVPAPAGPDV